MGKAEGVGVNWHGHVTAVTARTQQRRARLLRALPCDAAAPRVLRRAAQVAPEYRRQGLAQKLMGLLEETTIKRCAARAGARAARGAADARVRAPPTPPPAL